MREHIMSYCRERRKKRKTGNIGVTYQELLWQAAGEDERELVRIRTECSREFQKLLSDLVEEEILKPVSKSRRREFSGEYYEKYYIVGKTAERETDPQFIAKLHTYLGTKVFESYHYKKKEFLKDQEEIDSIYHYYRRPQKERLTSNELAYYLFGDEKAFEQPEKEKSRKVGIYTPLLKKMGLDLEKDLNACDTAEPFFCRLRQTFFEKERRNILIVENKDTYYRMNHDKIAKDYDCIIYGEGWKITSSFRHAEEAEIRESDRIDYFGDLDPEGFVIYQNLKEKCPQYAIHLQQEFYRKTIEALHGRTAGTIRAEVREETIAEAVRIAQELDGETAAYLKQMMEERRYIPQEAIAIALLAITEG